VSELKPCPFCGGKASKVTWMQVDSKPLYQVGCANLSCPITPSTEWLIDDKAAIDIWNTRSSHESVPHGKWVYETIGGKEYCYCSECGQIAESFEPHYCPSCGAKMEGGMKRE
jgi:hypothetical protein